MNWAYGITTVPERVDTLLKTTLESLTKAGFDKPILFVDGLTEAYVPPTNCGGVVIFHPKVGHIPNWQLALLHLYSTQPNADRYAIFEDDLLATKNLRQYLDHTPYPERGYWNLLTHPENLLLTNGNEGWHLSNQRGRGAVGLVFNREIARAILSSHIFLDRSACGSVAADGMVMDSVHILGYKEHIHFPTLLQHVGGNQSTMGHQYGEMPAWRGEDFDLTTLKQEEDVEPPSLMKYEVPIKWSILILTQPSRNKLLNKLLTVLVPQINAQPGIELLVTQCDYTASLGENRERMRQAAKGEYICFIDDDDLVSDDYVAKLFPQLDGVDYVGFQIQIFKDGVDTDKPAHNSLSYQKWYDGGDKLFRDISHICPIKKELALQVSMSGGFGEDSRWSDGMRSLNILKTEHVVDSVLYLYYWRTFKSDSQLFWAK